MGGKQQPGGGSVRDGRERERDALLSVKRKVFFLQLFKVDMFTQSIYLKKNIICYFLFVIPDILRQ